MPRDYYDILGLSKGASADEVKKAYRKLSKELHPDKNKGDKDAEQKFKEVNEAYEVLKDPKKKQAYDQFGHAGTKGGGYGGGQGGFDFSGFQSGDYSNLGDLFGDFFGGGGGGGRAQRDSRGGDIEVEIAVKFDLVINGGTKAFALNKWNTCESCVGTGAEGDSKIVICNECNGTGQVTKTAQSFFGVIQQSVMCGSCQGAGKKPEKACSHCGGEGRVQSKAELSVDIPAGIHDGQALRLKGKGHAGRTGTAHGDLYVRVSIEPDPHFVREGDDIRSTATISVVDAILGTEIDIETVQGSVKLKVPAGTQPGQVMRIKGKGLTVLGSSRHGDHFVKVNIEIPKKLSKKEKALVEEWRKFSN